MEEQLSSIIESTKFLQPEFVLVLGIIVLVVLDLFDAYPGPKLKIFTSIVVGLTCFGMTLYQWYLDELVFFSDTLQLNKLIVFFKLLFIAGYLFSFLFTSKNMENWYSKVEYHILLLGLLLGTLFMVMANNFLVVFLAIELVSLSSYLLTNFRFHKESYEASIKYLLIGALATAFMAYGISLIYGSSFSLAVEPDDIKSPELLFIGYGIFLFGLLFKITAAPFHIWAPNVYQLAPIPIAAFFSVIPKLAGIVILYKITRGFTGRAFFEEWQYLLSILIILTITIGNLSAYFQKDARRLMAYSSIAHSGYLLIGLLVVNVFGIKSIAFYGAIYLFMNFTVFLIINILENKGFDTIEAYGGLGKLMPLAGIAVVISMISLTGLPPTAGFTAKLMIFSSLWEELNGETVLLLPIVFIFGLLNTVVSLFFYLKIPFSMFFRLTPTEDINGPLTSFEIISIITLCLPLLVLFVKPDIIMNIIANFTV